MQLRLVPLRVEDIPAAATLAVEAGEWATRTPLLEDPTAILGSPNSSWQSALLGEELIGVVGVHSISWPDGCGELAWGVLPKWRGKGAGTNLARRCVEFAHLDLGLRRLTVHCTADAPSAKIAQTAGLKVVAHLANARLKRGKFVDTVILVKEA